MPRAKKEPRYYVVTVIAECATPDDALAYIEKHEDEIVKEDVRVIEGNAKPFRLRVAAWDDSTQKPVTKRGRKPKEKPVEGVAAKNGERKEATI